MIAILLATAATRATARPSWFVGEWCYPEGHPLRLHVGDAYDEDETTTYRANGVWFDEGEGGRWKIRGSRLIEDRLSVDPGFCVPGEPVRQHWTTRFVRHGRYAVSTRGAHIGWMVKCPVYEVTR